MLFKCSKIISWADYENFTSSELARVYRTFLDFTELVNICLLNNDKSAA